MNGAGDAFAGGFLGGMISGVTVEESKVGHRLCAFNRFVKSCIFQNDGHISTDRPSVSVTQNSATLILNTCGHLDVLVLTAHHP